MTGFALTLSLEDLGAGMALAAVAMLDRSLETEVMQPIGAVLEATTKERFDTNIGPDGEAWEPSLRATLTGGRTLTDTGVLRDSIHFRTEASAVEVGSADIRAPIHQFGGFIHAKTGAGLSFMLADGLGVTVDTVQMPERPFVGLSADDRAIVEDLALAPVRVAFDRYAQTVGAAL